MFNRGVVYYRNQIISTEERDGDFTIWYKNQSPAIHIPKFKFPVNYSEPHLFGAQIIGTLTLGSGQHKVLKCASKIMDADVVFGEKVLKCAGKYMADDITISVIKLFPSAPTSYILIGTYSEAGIWTAPEDGYYQIEIQGASGSGGERYARYVGGGGGGGGGCAISRVKLKEWDTLNLSPGLVGSDSMVEISSSIETYDLMNVSSGENGEDAVDGNSTPLGGLGGIATGGNYENYTGGTGGTGESGCTKGVGGTAGHPDGNSGGAGGGYAERYELEDPEFGKDGFIKIYRGDTNLE